MPTIPILPSRLIVTTILNSISFLASTNIADRILSENQIDSKQEEISNTNAENFYINGLKDLAENELHSAVENFSSAIKINPCFAPAYNDRGISRYKLGYKKLALADLTAAININPYRYKYYNNRGFMLARLGDYAGAIADYNSALLLNSNLAQTYFKRGNIYLKMNDLIAAMADFDSAIGINPDFGKAYFNRGITKYKLKNVQEGFEDFQKASELFKQQGKIEDHYDAVSKIKHLW